MGNSIYKENQYFKTIIILFTILMTFLFLVYIMKWGRPGKLLTLRPLIIFELICLLVIAVFYKMVIEIKDNVLSISFGIGLIKKRLDINNIKKDTIEIRKIPFYYGMGVRLTRYGTLFNTAPGQAVSFTTRGKKRFAIGSQDTSKLKKILQEA